MRKYGISGSIKCQTGPEKSKKATNWTEIDCFESVSGSVAGLFSTKTILYTNQIHW